MLPSNNLSLVIALLTNISLFYILKPYILINFILGISFIITKNNPEIYILIDAD
jgi:hypothetical protein